VALPPRHPLPRPVIDPAKPLLKLGLDVHLEFIMAVAQQDHANPRAPRKFSREELVAQVGRWEAEGFQVFWLGVAVTRIEALDHPHHRERETVGKLNLVTLRNGVTERSVKRLARKRGNKNGVAKASGADS
jgi:hypothetical protein